MDWTSFFIVFLACAITMLICRVVPVFALKGRELPANAVRALIANDLLSPTVFANGPWPALIPFIAAALVLVVGYKTKSLVWCIVVGVGSYALLTFI